GDFRKYFEIEKLNQARFLQDAQGGDRSNSDSWYELGPYSKPTCGGGSGFGIGPIRFIQFNKTNANMMLCGSEGGLFVTYDGGLNWTNANTDVGWMRSGCSWADIDPNNSNNWFGSNNEWLGYVKGIWRTTNSGGTWELIADHDDLGAD